MAKKYTVADLPKASFIPGIVGQFVHTEKATFAVNTLEKGTVLPAHGHPHEQTAYVLAGSFEYDIEGVKTVIRAGDFFVVPSNVVHGGKALEGSIIIDIFVPVREDYKHDSNAHEQLQHVQTTNQEPVTTFDGRRSNKKTFADGGSNRQMEEEDAKTRASAVVYRGPPVVGHPTACIVVGMAGSGKTTLLRRIGSFTSQNEIPWYSVNLDPAVKEVPFGPNIDIRETVSYKEVMTQYNLGPNGAILTALNLFTTRFDQVLTLLEKRKADVSHIFFDTPGQIEVFNWSASGRIITESLASTLPTVVLFVVDTPRCANPATFMSNMLYACSLLYKMQLPLIMCFTKTDVVAHDFAVEWMTDFESFLEAVDASDDDSYANSFSRSLALVLDSFYEAIPTVGVSALTGAGMTELFTSIDAATAVYHSTQKRETESRREEQLQGEQDRQRAELDRLRAEIEDLSTHKTYPQFASSRRGFIFAFRILRQLLIERQQGTRNPSIPSARRFLSTTALSTVVHCFVGPEDEDSEISSSDDSSEDGVRKEFGTELFGEGTCMMLPVLDEDDDIGEAIVSPPDSSSSGGGNSSGKKSGRAPPGYRRLLRQLQKSEQRQFRVERELELQKDQRDMRIQGSRAMWENLMKKDRTAWDIQSSRIRRLAFQGIPSALRGAVWQRAIGNRLHITLELYDVFRQHAQNAKEAELTLRAASHPTTSDVISDGGCATEVLSDASSEVPESAERMMAYSRRVIGKEASIALVMLDVPRTFPSLAFFRPGGPMNELLEQTLMTYVCYRPDVGYVQGMSYLAALLLLQMEPFDAFVALANILDSELHRVLYNMDVLKMRHRISVFDRLMRSMFPLLHRRLRELELSPDIYLIDWHMTLFAKALPLDVGVRVLDCYFFEGEPFLFRTALAIFSVLQSQLVVASFADCFRLITHPPPQVVREEKLFAAISRIPLSAQRFQALLKKAEKSQ